MKRFVKINNVERIMFFSNGNFCPEIFKEFPALHGSQGFGTTTCMLLLTD